MLIEENKFLAPFTTLGVGGPARWFVEVSSDEDVVEAAKWAREREIPLFVLGGGSNLLVSDAGFNGLVVHVGLHGIQVAHNSGFAIYQAAAGEDWDMFVERTVKDGCAGIECLAGIPGTVGGTPVQNVGAYGQEVSSSILRVRTLDLSSLEFTEFEGADCEFSYRRSRFNTTDRGRFLVTRVDYRLTVGGAPTVRYADLQKAFTTDHGATLAEVTSAVRRIRQSKGMLLVNGDADCRSAGSFFKNPVVSFEQLRQIAKAAGKEPPHFPAGAGNDNPGMVKVPAAWLIEQAGFSRGFVSGTAGISTRHTLALINRGGATAEEILALAEEIRAAVNVQFGIRLEMEPVQLGFDTQPA